MIMDVISYIRNFFGGSTRKRCASDDLDFASPAKFSKLHSTSTESEWESFSSFPRSRLNFMDPIDTSFKTIVIDDGPTIRNHNGAKPKTFTSTPSSKTNGFSTESPHMSKGAITRTSLSKKIENVESTASKHYHVKSNFAPKSLVMNNITSRRKIPLANKHTPSNSKTDFNFIFRLDEKRKYAELMRKSLTGNTFNLDKFSKYRPALTKLSSNIERSGLLPGKKFIEIDLTNGDSNKSRSNRSSLSTKDTIIKVLDDIDNEVVDIKDSDSEVEILPTPPSPKPDIKVERINSLKTIVLPSEPFHQDWIKNKLKSHNEVIARREKEIKERKVRLNQIREINEEVRIKTLEDQVKKCMQIKEVILPAEVEKKLPPLTDEQEAKVRMALDRSKNPNAVLASKFSLNITRRDMLTLSGLNWFNDEVINFYMNLIIERGKTPNFPKAYAFNTFFYPKLLKDGHSSIRRWTRKIDIFAHDIICVPIHLSVHWCMAIIDFRKKFIGYYDSMGSPNQQCVEALAQYLQDEHLDKKKSPYDVSDWTLKCLRDIPQQMNGSDCGMFACTFAEFLSRDAATTFSQEDMPYLRRKMVVEIMNGELLIK